MLSKGSFSDPVLGADGWYTLSYTFADDINGIHVDSNSRFGVFFRGLFIANDIIEIREIMLNDKPLEIIQSNIKSSATLSNEPMSHDWNIKNYAVLFATGTPGEVDKFPLAQRVTAGGFVVVDDAQIHELFYDSAKTMPFDLSTPINDNITLYYN